MKRKIFLISAAILPVLMMVAGCGGGYSEAENPNEMHIYHHYTNDDYNPWVDAFKPMSDFGKSTQETMRDEQRDVRQMERDNRDMFHILNSAQQQDNIYRQQQRH